MPKVSSEGLETPFFRSHLQKEELFVFEMRGRHELPDVGLQIGLHFHANDCGDVAVKYVRFVWHPSVPADCHSAE